MSFGKWIGGSIGWSLGGPIGAVAGFALGALFDKSIDKSDESASNYSEPQTTQPGDFGMSMVILSAAVMKADNRIMKSELEFVKSYLVRQFGQEQAKELISALKEVLKTDVPVRQICLQIRSHMSHPMRLQLMHYLFGVGYADGNVDRVELHTLNTIGRYLGISQKDFYSINAMFGGQSSHSGSRPGSSSLGIPASYKILEINANVSDDEVKKAYRKMAKKYHPDKVASLGPNFQTAAKEKFQKVQQAYEEVKKNRGMN
jgi:DnaJ like chaperone protein